MIKRKLIKTATLLAAIMLSAGICLTGCNKQPEPEPVMEDKVEDAAEDKGESSINATLGSGDGEAVKAETLKTDEAAEAVNGIAVNSKGGDTILGEDEYKGDDEDTTTTTDQTTTDQTTTDQTTNTNQQTTNPNEKLSMTDAEIHALLKKYPNLATIDEVKNVLKTGTTPEEVEELLQEMQADRAKNPPQQQTQTTPQNNTPKGTGGYGELMPEEFSDPNYVHGQSGQEGLSTNVTIH